MKNPKILLSVIGGLTAVLALVLGWLIWSDASARTENTEALDEAIAQADRLVRLPVRPGPAAITAVNSNRTAYATWRTETLAAISRGDRTFEPVTPPAFKTYLVAEARRLSSLPGAAAGKLVKPDFPFGFKDYITGGVLPTLADLPRLQREWSDISTVVELLATNGVSEILDVRVAAAAAAPADEQGSKADKRKNRKRAKAAADEAFKPDITRFTVDFLARPEALVSFVNGAAAATRYIVIEDFRFAREKDVLVEELGGEEKSAAAPAAGGRRSRRRAAAVQAEATAAEAPKTGVVTDPATAAPLKVTMVFAVYDFRSAGQKAETEGKGAK